MKVFYRLFFFNCINESFIFIDFSNPLTRTLFWLREMSFGEFLNKLSFDRYLCFHHHLPFSSLLVINWVIEIHVSKDTKYVVSLYTRDCKVEKNSDTKVTSKYYAQENDEVLSTSIESSALPRVNTRSVEMAKICYWETKLFFKTVTLTKQTFF